MHQEVIGARGEGRRVDAYLADRYRHTALDGWREHIAAGRVRLDDAETAPDAVLRPGQRLAWHRPPWEEPEAPLALDVLYTSPGVLVVAKPAGLPTLPGGGFLQHTLLHQVRQLDPAASPLHRLGRWTSGAVVCGLTRPASAAITAQFVARTVHKRYRALAAGVASESTFAVATPIGPVPYPPLGTVHAADPAGRPARSSVTVVEQRGDQFLCDVVIATGRPHQIRIHLAAAGHPLVGDPLYVVGGGPAAGCVAVPGDPGYLLHAAEIRFDDPTGRGPVTVLAPVPAALADPQGGGA